MCKFIVNYRYFLSGKVENKNKSLYFSIFILNAHLYSRSVLLIFGVSMLE